MIILKDNSRLILVQKNNLDQKLETAMGKYWNEITMVNIETALQKVTTINLQENLSPEIKEKFHPKRISLNQKEAVRELLNCTGIDYISDAIISFPVGTIMVNVKLLKIPRPGKLDLVVESGEIYGSALESIKKEGYELLSLPLGDTIRKMAIKLFSNLGIKVVEEPSFTNDTTKKTVIIPGVYIENATRKILLAEKQLDLETSEFMKRQGIILLYAIAPKN